MYILVTKTEQWRETYLSTMADNGISLICKPCSFDSFEEYKKHFSGLPEYVIEEIDENNFNIKEKKQ